MSPTSMCVLLLVGDDELRERWRTMVQAVGWSVYDAPDVRSAIDAAIRHQPHVIVTELYPADVSGFHFVRTLRGTVDHDVVVAGVARGPQDVVPDAKAAGFDLSFQKTIDLDALQKAVASPDDTKPTTRFRILK